jgi:hypothetical protein
MSGTNLGAYVGVFSAHTGTYLSSSSYKPRLARASLRFTKRSATLTLKSTKCLFARFKMLPATFVLTRVYYVSSSVAMIRSGHFFPLGFSPRRRRAVSIDDLIFYLVTRLA